MLRMFLFKTFSRFENKMINSQKNKEKEHFKKEITALISKPTYTLKDYKRKIYDSLYQVQKGIRAKFMSDNEKNEAHLIHQRKILDAFMENELQDDKLLSTKGKREIAQITQVTVEDVNIILKNYRLYKDMHVWLRKKNEKGEKIPDNQEDLMANFRKERPMSYFTKRNMPRPNFNKKMRLKALMWGTSAVKRPDYSYRHKILLSRKKKQLIK